MRTRNDVHCRCTQSVRTAGCHVPPRPVCPPASANDAGDPYRHETRTMNPRRFFELVLVKVRMNLRSEVSSHQLNYLWWLLEPALFVAAFYLVFEVLLAQGGNDFVAFLVCGNAAFLWFSKSVNNASGSIVAGRGIIAHVNLPKIFFPLVVVLQDAAKQGFVLALVLVFLLLLGYPPTAAWLALPLVVLVQFVFVLASGLAVACIVPALPDFRFIIATGMMLLMFASGIFYRYQDIVRADLVDWFLLNPMAVLINSYREVLMYAAQPDWMRLGWIFFFSCLVIVACSTLLHRQHGRYSRLVMQ